jgi:hypothetical protein
MSTLLQIRSGLKTALATIGGLNTHSAEPGQVTPPAAVVVTPAIDYGISSSYNRLNVYEFRVIVLVSAGLSDEAAHILDTYADPNAVTSIRAAIEYDPTLGGVTDTLVVNSFRPLDVEEVAALGYWGGDFSVTVYAR